MISAHLLPQLLLLFLMLLFCPKAPTSERSLLTDATSSFYLISHQACLSCQQTHTMWMTGPVIHIVRVFFADIQLHRLSDEDAEQTLLHVLVDEKLESTVRLAQIFDDMSAEPLEQQNILRSLTYSLADVSSDLRRPHSLCPKPCSGENDADLAFNFDVAGMT